MLLYGKYVGKALGKDIPHKDIDLYRFVLEPLAEIAPNLIHPKHQKKIGRKDRSKKFSDREIDIDLLLYGKYVGKALGKDIPHKDIDLYRFVLEPLAEIAPNLIHPKHQEKISEIWKKKLNSFA